MIRRKVFLSFDFDDVWRVNQVRFSQQFLEVKGFTDVADIEKVKKSSYWSIKRWIDNQMQGASVTVVLIGRKTYASRWVAYEIGQSKKLGMGLLGIHIHRCKDRYGLITFKGTIPKGLHGNDEVHDWSFISGPINIKRWIDAAARAVRR